MAFEPGPRMFYYLFRVLVTIEDITFEDLDAELNHIKEDLEVEFSGEGREFSCELDNFDPEFSMIAEILLGFTVFPYSDEEADIERILKGVQEKFEEIGLLIEEIVPLGEPGR